jgi:hypothetical protein
MLKGFRVKTRFPLSILLNERTSFKTYRGQFWVRAFMTYLLHHPQTAIETDEKVTLVVLHPGERSLGVEVGQGETGSVEGNTNFVEDCGEVRNSGSVDVVLTV